VKTTAWSWLGLLLIPGCLLVQPLDEAKPEDGGSAGNGSGGGPSKAGSSGSTSKAGSGNAGRGGGAPNGGATSGNAGRGGGANGGAANGVDFSLFTGTWTVTSGETTTFCDGVDPTTEEVTPGGKDTVGLGTTSDLIFGPGSNCEILADVDDRNASLNSDTKPCSETDGTYNYYLTVDAFHFTVSGDGQTAEAGMITTVLTTDANDNLLLSCEVQTTWSYER